MIRFRKKQPIETLSPLERYYNRFDEDSRLLSRQGQVEFRTSVRYMEKYLKPGMKILEIGAGTGRYSHYFARKGYAVHAVELIAHNIRILQKNTHRDENLTVTQANAMDLSCIDSDSFDLVLLLGPMYHLYEQADQKKALSEAIRTAKPGGILFASYCMADAAIIQGAFLRNQWKDYMQKGLLDPQSFDAHSTPEDLFELYRTEKIDELMEDFPVQRLHFVSTDGLSRYFREKLAKMDRETFETYLQYHFTVCERPDMVGAANHTLDIFRKEEV